MVKMLPVGHNAVENEGHWWLLWNVYTKKYTKCIDLILKQNKDCSELIEFTVKTDAVFLFTVKGYSYSTLQTHFKKFHDQLHIFWHFWFLDFLVKLMLLGQMSVVKRIAT